MAGPIILWAMIVAFIASTALEASVLAQFGIPWRPLSSISGLNPYVLPGPTANLEGA